MWTAPLVYPILALRTAVAVLRRRPRAVVVVAPPFVAPLVAVPISRLIGAKVAIDVHSGAIVDRKWRWSLPILRVVARAAHAVIVTLPSLSGAFARTGTPVHVVPDPLPDLRPSGGVEIDPELVVAICGWGSDEPIEALVSAAEKRTWRLVLTGSPRFKPKVGDNVSLAGFMPNQAYVDLVASAAVVVVLTNRDETLLSGAWEAIALGRPLVISGTSALRSTFSGFVDFVDNDSDSIAGGINYVLSHRGECAAASNRGRSHFLGENERRLAAVADLLR